MAFRVLFFTPAIFTTSRRRDLQRLQLVCQRARGVQVFRGTPSPPAPLPILGEGRRARDLSRFPLPQDWGRGGQIGLPRRRRFCAARIGAPVRCKDGIERGVPPGEGVPPGGGG